MIGALYKVGRFSIMSAWRTSVGFVDRVPELVHKSWYFQVLYGYYFTSGLDTLLVLWYAKKEFGCMVQFVH